ncbi:hypothetical protein GXW74_14735 [Roseomonas eburnea]|uniref:Uncharacterized protein n=1 Tax=Neoroseomonas eburnea TaxID=1346889 RepID=A0A9X9XDG2_9PROT|nr:hypothetical protein [Neoroseomonas eburnea]MBR0681748.1 hypothetical protein [Neoroseomonas eburnea]
MLRILPLLLLLAAPAFGQMLPTQKPAPLGAMQVPPPALAAPPPAMGAPTEPAAPAAGGRCAAPLAQGCMRMQASCQMACPGIWSTNPAAPAFTPTDRAGCMQRCFQQYLSCQRTYGC